MFCTKCGKEFEGNFCPNCGTAIEQTISIAKEETPAPIQKSAPAQISSKTAGIVVIIAIVVFVGGMLKSYFDEDTTTPTQAQTEATTTEVTTVASKYKTSTEWADITQNYMFAVEIDGFDGDVLQSKTYNFDVTNNKLGETPMYDIYIRKQGDLNLSSLGNCDFTVGGSGYTSTSHKLNKGDYVYIVPCELAYTPKGYLKIS